MDKQKKIRLYDALIRCCTTLAFVLAIATLYFHVVSPALGRRQSGMAMLAAVTAYAQEASGLPQTEIDAHLLRAYLHNAEIARQHAQLIHITEGESLPSPLGFGEWAALPYDYTGILNIAGTMARLEIERIDVDLPVLHGTGPEAMMNGVGHLEGTAFPIGGYGTHPVLMTHSGKRTATLFSRLHELDYGDRFVIYVLDRRLVYEVDRITVIWPFEIDYLRVVPGADMVTLITCTPIHINTHRLLVRGVRVACDNGE